MFARLCIVALATAAPAVAADPAPKRLLLVTHSGGFVHDSLGHAEDVVKEIGPKHGLAVTCWRYTGDPNGLAEYAKKFRERTGKPVEPEHCGRINKDTLKNFDAVLFVTTGNPMTADELKDFTAWVNAGGAFCGAHCATDTHYNAPPYGELIGGYFRTHPSGLQKVKLRVDDPAHPAAAPFKDGQIYEDEIYIFKDEPYSRQKLNVILSVGPDSNFPPVNPKNPKQAEGQKRKDGDYAIAWSKTVGKGRVFYTSLGHPKKTWDDPTFQAHLVAGIKWATAPTAAE